MENKPMISETEKREALKQFMAEKAKAPVCVAFSGGVDSSLILKLACDTAKKTGSGQPLLYLQTPPVRDTSGFCKRRGDSVRDGRNQ